MSNPTILVPLDGSKFSEAAIPVALGVAKCLGGDVQLVSAHENQPVVAGWTLSAQGVREKLDAYLADVESRIGQVSTVPVTRTVIGGHITKVLVEYIQRRAPTLVVMSTHGRGAISRFWLGSVADRIVRYVDMPVLLVRPGPHEEQPPLEERGPFQRVLVPLDGSERAEASLDWAARLAGSTGECTLIRIVPQIQLMTPYLPHAVEDTSRTMEANIAEAHEYLDVVANRVRRERGVVVDTVVSTSSGSAAGILRALADEDYDLTVVATHGRSGLARLVLGSVSDKVVRGAAGPVLVVRTVASDAALDITPADAEALSGSLR